MSLNQLNNSRVNNSASDTFNRNEKGWLNANLFWFFRSQLLVIRRVSFFIRVRVKFKQVAKRVF
jgi:hypothetical protein